jgi:hypothetical protein
LRHSDDESDEALLEANTRLISNYYRNQMRITVAQAESSDWRVTSPSEDSGNHE